MSALTQMLETWEARSRGANPCDAMLINKHIREVRELLAANAVSAEPQVQAKVSWNLKYADSTPKLNVGNSAFEDWFQQQPFATQIGVKQMCRDAYAAGMGDPLVTYAHPQATEPAWRPIETAPKDGTVIDLWHEEFGRWPGCNWGLPEHSCGESGALCDDDVHSMEEGWVTDFNEITFPASEYLYWMPIPAAPEQKQ